MEEGSCAILMVSVDHVPDSQSCIKFPFFSAEGVVRMKALVDDLFGDEGEGEVEAEVEEGKR